ncbi:hypothetical protein DSO57_1015446 [Entomophthora muscae]|uniref:Uncharacterized protein n=1 Tax=Entomophthora muscae TaxID=34485 RepID=A0ACC2U370_9FUNG|nr:hypothetical protein DSO57_1015446 [Entomophthora muscae]
MSIAPSQTVYASNLNEKINKLELKKNLYSLFTTYGRVIDIVALKTGKARGQAFIVFADITSATGALRALQKFNFLGKEMNLNYAKTTSNVIKRLDGSYKTELLAPITSSMPAPTTAGK